MSYKVGYGKEPEDPAKVLGALLVDACKAVKEGRKIFFETLDDGRGKPADSRRAAEEGLERAAGMGGTERARELDYAFRCAAVALEDAGKREEGAAALAALAKAILLQAKDNPTLPPAPLPSAPLLNLLSLLRSIPK